MPRSVYSTKSTIESRRWSPSYGSWLFLSSILGLVAAFELTMDKIQSLVSPGTSASCDFSVLVQCTANLNSAQGAVFGFPNPIIGLVAWPFVLATAVLILLEVSLPKFWWYGFLAGMTFAVIFVTWLQYQSIMVLGTLCPWCIATWFAVIPAFIATVVHIGELGLFSKKLSTIFSRIRAYIPLISILWLFGIAAGAQLRLDWVASIVIN